MSASEQQKLEAALPGRNYYLWIALLCGAVPLTVGSLIYWTWRYTRSESLPPLGLWTVLFGLPVFVLGMICLFRYRTVALRCQSLPRQRVDRNTLVVAGLLIVNFPAAAFYGLSAAHLMSGTIVTVANHSGQTIESCILNGPGVKVELGPIPSGSERMAYLSFRGDGMLSFSAREADVSFDGELSKYVTGGIGGEMTLELLPGRDFKVTENVTSGD